MTGPYICCNASRAFINNNSTPVPIPAVFCTLTPMPAQTSIPTKIFALIQAPAFILALASIPSSLKKYLNKDL